MLGPAFLPFLGVFSPQRGEGTQQRKISEKERKEEITMEKIASFTIDHIKLQPGVYVSRKDKVGDSTVTTFDLRMTSPNEEPVMNTAEMHTIEHLGATFLRNHKDFGDKTVYFGPMGCRTGFYLLLAGDYESKDILPLVVEMYEFVRDFEGEVPGASPKDCGNYLDMNLGMAKYLAAKYLKVLTILMSSRSPDWFIQNKGEYFASLRGAVECNSFPALCGDVLSAQLLSPP